MFWIVFQIIKRCVRKPNKTTQKASYSFWFKAGCFRVGFLQMICVPCPQVGSVAVLPVISLKIIKKVHDWYVHNLSLASCPLHFKRSMSSWVRPKFSSCIGVSWARCGKALRRRSQHSSSRLGTTSQILNKEPVRLFSWMFTTPPCMYMQPAWNQRGTVLKCTVKIKTQIGFDGVWTRGRKFLVNFYKLSMEISSGNISSLKLTRNLWKFTEMYGNVYKMYTVSSPGWQQHSGSTQVQASLQVVYSTGTSAGWSSTGHPVLIRHYNLRI